MVLAAQRLAALIRIIRKESPNEPINIVAHSQGCFVSMLAHAILGSGAAAKPSQEVVKADTLILNNWPYSVNQPLAERIQVSELQQTISAREETLARIVGYVVGKPSILPKFAELKEKGEGVVGAKWQHDVNKERDNRGKIYLYYSPDDLTVGLANIQGIGWWGLYDHMLKKLGGRFLQRVFASAKGPTTGAPPVGSSPHRITLGFKWNMASLITRDKTRQINAEELPEPFLPELGPASMLISPIDAKVAVANPYRGKDKDGKEKTGRLAGESPELATARWMGRDEKNSYHSSIVSNPMHSEKATAYDLCIGVSGILKDNDLLWIQFLRAVADWRTNWFGSSVDDRTDNTAPSFPPPATELIALLKNADKVASAERAIIEGNYHYYCIGGTNPGSLPDFTKNCTVASVARYVMSETTGKVADDKKTMDQYYNGG
jgi:hypothetical protein